MPICNLELRILLRFQEGPGVVELKEDALVGQVVWQAQARSALSISYLIVSGNSQGHFTINPTTGVITLKHLLDYETTTEFNLTVSATNLVSRINSCGFQI